MTRRGLTLLEVLAATVLLGLLAAAATPLLQRVGAGRLRSTERLDADAALVRGFDRLRQPFATGTPGSAPIADHPGWMVEWEPMERRAQPAPGSIQVPRRWWRVTVVDSQRAVLAERLMPVPAGGP